jgi:dTDP-4-amino-4,6-dideoxygalactose transaminase
VTALALHGGPPAVSAPLPRAWPWLSPPARARVDALLDAGFLSDYALGDTLAELERVVADYQGCRYALGAASGTAALHMAYHAVGVRPGDEVIVPSYSFHATVAPLFLLGAVPVLCDVDPLTGVIDLADAEARITDRTRAVAVTHLWGHPVDADGLAALRRRGVRVVEDGSHAHGARAGGRLVGSFGDAAAFSLGARKMVSGGLGGVLVTDDEDVFAAALPLGHCHERAQLHLPAEDVAVGLGANYRLSPIAAAICIEQYRDLDDRIARKRAVLTGLAARLEGLPGLRPQHTAAGVDRGGWYGYKARYLAEETGRGLDEVLADLQAAGLAVDRPSNQPLHWRPLFTSTRLDPTYYVPGRQRPVYRRGELPGAERYYAESLSFPAPHLHEPCDDLLDQYRNGLQRVLERKAVPA